MRAAAAGHPAQAYAILFASAFVENVFPPVPGDTVTVFGAYLVGRGVLTLWPVIGATFAGSTAGFMALYGIGRALGQVAVERVRWVRRRRAQVEKAEDAVRRHGIWVVLANRFMPGFRSVVSLAVGILRMPAWEVLLATSVSIFAWNALLIGAGLLVGKNWERVVAAIRQYNLVAGMVLVAVAVAIGVWLWRRRRSARP